MKPTLDDLARGKADFNIKNTIKQCAMNRSAHRLSGTKGYTKSKCNKSIARIPFSIYFNPWYRERFFNNNMDGHEGQKAMYEFLKIHPEFKTCD